MLEKGGGDMTSLDSKNIKDWGSQFELWLNTVCTDAKIEILEEVWGCCDRLGLIDRACVCYRHEEPCFFNDSCPVCDENDKPS